MANQLLDEKSKQEMDLLARFIQNEMNKPKQDQQQDQLEEPSKDIGFKSSKEVEELGKQIYQQAKQSEAEIKPLQKKALLKTKAPEIVPEEVKATTEQEFKAAASGKKLKTTEEEYKDIIERMKSEANYLRSVSEAKQAAAQKEAMAEFEKTKPTTSTEEIIARSIIALAPALIGKAAAGSLGGLAGSEASISALSQMQRLKEQQQKYAQETAEKKLAAAVQFHKDDLDKIDKMEEQINKARLEYGLLPMKTELLKTVETLKAYPEIQLRAAEQQLRSDLQNRKDLNSVDALNMKSMLDVVKMALSTETQQEIASKKIEAKKAEVKKAEDKKPGVGQQTLDRNFAKDYASWIESGGSAAIKSNIEVLENSIKELATTDYASGPFIQFAPDMMKQKGTRIKESIETSVQESLKRILGSAYTEREGRQVLARAFNPALQEEENMERASRVLVKLKSMAALKEEAIKYFEENETLKGFKGLDQFNKIYSDLKGDVVTVGEGLQVPTETEAKKDVPRVGPDGKIYYYNWNEKTGKWE